MGYTSYWNFKSSTTDKENKKKALKEIKKVLRMLPEKTTTAGGYSADLPLVLRGGDGTGEPIFTEKEICFNGDDEGGIELSHETFYFNVDEPSDFEFCKTARKPYDFMVCICLIALANNLENFSFSSDGDKEDWEPAINFYKLNVGKIKQSVKLPVR